MRTLGLIALMALTYLLNGVALKLLWGWYMIGAFGLPAISLAQAIGIGIIVALLTLPHIPRDEDQMKEMLLYCVLQPLFAIAAGWIVHFSI